MKGMGRMVMGVTRNVLDRMGIITYRSPHDTPITDPMLNARHRQPSRFCDVSASAVAPPACTRARGKVSRSTSLVTRKRMYPIE